MATIIGDIDYYRGDDYPLEMTFKDKATQEAIDLTGYSFIMTIDTLKKPPDATTKVFDITGVVDPDQVTNAGKVSFTPTDVQTDIDPKGYFYDIQMTDAGGHKRTVVKYKFTILQDITK